jgi:hypothetical protein
MTQGLHIRVDPKYLLILCGTLGDKKLVPNLWVGLKTIGRCFQTLKLSTWAKLAHPLDDEHLYRRSMKGTFFSLIFLLKNIGT